MTNLSVNVNKIAWLRNARGGQTPNIVELSELIIDCGVSGITVHPRPDLRHITPEDVYILRELTLNKKVEFNIEGNPYSESNAQYPGFQEIIKIAKPDQCTLVPDSLEQITSDHGWDFINRETSEDKDLVNSLKESAERVSFFVDPSATISPLSIIIIRSTVASISCKIWLDISTSFSFPNLN